MSEVATIECEATAAAPTKKGEAATFVVFSAEMDKALAAFTLANASAAAGMKTTIFFAFWGLCTVRAEKRVSRGSFMDRVFGFLLPRGANRLPTSRLNFFGLGPRMFRWRMAQKRQPDLVTLMAQARALGVQLQACAASADMLGIAQEDLVEGVKIAGAMTCMRDAALADVALFI